jgi:hypothetical protein
LYTEPSPEYLTLSRQRFKYPYSASYKPVEFFYSVLGSGTTYIFSSAARFPRFIPTVSLVSSYKYFSFLLLVKPN